jgi:hypothetical protein
MEKECDHCLPKKEYEKKLISYIQDWVAQAKNPES